MDLLARFQEYADTFEGVVENDDWSVLEPYFTEDAVYETHGEPPFAGRSEGRDQVFAAIRTSLDSTDRRFDTRELEILEGPKLVDGAVWFRWRVRYGRAGKAYNVSGNRGVVLAFDHGRTLLLGSQRADELAAAIHPRLSRAIG